MRSASPTASRASRFELDLGPSASRLLETRGYLASLPQGFSSYPDHTQKASIYRTFLAETDFSTIADKLPSAIRKIVERPLLPSTWVTETLATSLFLAARDLCFDDDDDFVEHFHGVNRTIISSPMYRVLFALASPERFLSGSPKRMATLHRGIGVDVSALHEKVVRIELTSPPNLIPRLIARCYATGFGAAARAAGGKEVAARLIRHEPLVSTFEISWT